MATNFYITRFYNTLHSWKFTDVKIKGTWWMKILSLVCILLRIAAVLKHSTTGGKVNFTSQLFCLLTHLLSRNTLCTCLKKFLLTDVAFVFRVEAKMVVTTLVKTTIFKQLRKLFYMRRDGKWVLTLYCLGVIRKG